LDEHQIVLFSLISLELFNIDLSVFHDAIDASVKVAIVAPPRLRKLALIFFLYARAAILNFAGPYWVTVRFSPGELALVLDNMSLFADNTRFLHGTSST
jgi:hypothetical protein